MAQRSRPSAPEESPPPDHPPLGPRQRALLKLLQEASGELSGQELHLRLLARHERHGLATVYRGLKQLQRAGLVRSRKQANGESLYAPLERDEHHLTCVSCGRSDPLPVCPVDSAGLRLGTDVLRGFKPLFHTFEVHGLCSSCQREEEPLPRDPAGSPSVAGRP